jgi:asparagine synthase (glutamine-hydrolysing)
MLAAVVHARGAEAARERLGRATREAGEPDLVATSFGTAVAGWRSSVPLAVDPGFALEGTVDPIGSLASIESFPRDFGRLRGDFAALVPTKEGLVVASGPGSGHRPIFVASGKDWSAASTRLGTLLRLLDSKPPLDTDYVASCTVSDYPLDPTATPYAAVHQVPLCEAWRLRPGMEAERRPILDDPPTGELHADESELARLLREAIFKAAERAASGAKKIGVMFSGGLDSSSILLALDALQKSGRLNAPFEAYSWEFDTPDPNDDRPFRRAVERKLGKQSNPIDPRAAGAFVRRAMVLDAAPCIDTPCPLWFALFEAARAHGVDRIMTGLGGDNVLDGHPRMFGDLARRGQWVRALLGAAGLQGVDNASARLKLHAFVLRPLGRALVPEAIQVARRRLVRRRPFRWMGPRFAPWIEQHAAVAPSLPTLDWSPADRYAALARMPFLADMARIRSQQEVATGLRRTEPLFEEPLLRLVATLPPMALLSGGYLRGLLREAMNGVLPDEVRLRPWKAYMDPALAEMVAGAGGFCKFADLARVSRLADLGLVDPTRFRVAFDKIARRPLEVFWSTVWPALAVEEFLRQYDEGGLT